MDHGIVFFLFAAQPEREYLSNAIVLTRDTKSN